jgi:hypothetical protein
VKDVGPDLRMFLPERGELVGRSASLLLRYEGFGDLVGDAVSERE